MEHFWDPLRESKVTDFEICTLNYDTHYAMSMRFVYYKLLIGKYKLYYRSVQTPKWHLIYKMGRLTHKQYMTLALGIVTDLKRFHTSSVFSLEAIYSEDEGTLTSSVI